LEFAVLRIVQFPHPTLLRPSKPLRRVDAEVHQFVAEMFDLMYQHNGCGLAANQVDLPYRLFVMNTTGKAAEKEQEQVFINPVLSKHKGMKEDEEGCLSLPGLYAPVRRPERVTVSGYNLAGEKITLDTSGLFARVVQHEVDHLDGIMFIDRLTPTGRIAVKEALAEFETEFHQRRDRGEIPDDRRISARLAELEEQRT
jgi:peptide deformylase